MTPQPQQRPEGVAADARWDESEGAWRVGNVDGQGRPDGAQHFVRSDGTMLAQYVYLAGERSGPYRRYHSSGELAREGELRRGIPVGLEKAYAATSQSSERLRACCVPPGAWSMHVSHEPEGWSSETFFDRAGNRLLPDGSVHPEHPDTVDPKARYVSEKRLWELGARTPAGRMGLWKWWSETGLLLETGEFELGARHGAWERYKEGVLVSSLRYEAGNLHGKCWERVSPGTYKDERIAAQAGHYTHGLSSGRWRYLDDQGQLLGEAEAGLGLEELSVDDPVFANPMDVSLAMLVTRGDYSRAALLGFCTGKSTATLLAPLNPTVVRAGVTAALMTKEASHRWVKAIREQRGSVSQVMGRLLCALMRGAAPEMLLREMASYLMRRPLAGLQLIDAAIELDATAVEAWATKVLLLLEAGRVEDARQVQARLSRLHPIGAQPVASLVAVVFPTFDFWPLRIELQVHPASELPDTVGQGVDRLRLVIAKLALRLRIVRDSLLEQLSIHADDAPDWLPPDMSCLSLVNVQLETYTFEAVFPAEDGGEEVDVVSVEERLFVDGLSITELMRRARIEWTALCWICFSAGLSEVKLPSEVHEPSLFGHAVGTAFARYSRLEDQLQTAGLRSRAKGVQGFEWQGMPIEGLSPTLLRQARDEYLEMRTALYFAADATCRSLWQDDLRV